MPLVVIAPPTQELITLEYAKLFLRVIGTDEDTLIPLFITAARERVEAETSRSIATVTLERSFDCFPACSEIKLSLSPVQSVSHIKYNDESGAEVTFSSDKYTVDIKSKPGRIVLKEGVSWPSTTKIPNAVRITYVAGYSSIDSLEASLKVGWLWLINHLYTNRDIVLTGPMSSAIELPEGLSKMLWPLRIGS